MENVRLGYHVKVGYHYDSFSFSNTLYRYYSSFFNYFISWNTVRKSIKSINEFSGKARTAGLGIISEQS